MFGRFTSNVHSTLSLKLRPLKWCIATGGKLMIVTFGNIAQSGIKS